LAAVPDSEQQENHKASFVQLWNSFKK
jgi:hypothetical protein